MPIQPVIQRSLGHRVANQLRRLIATREIVPDTVIVEDELAAKFGVSRGPVRDAIKILSAEGLVATKGRRAVIRGLTADDVDELFSLRLMLEGTALRMAMAHDHTNLVRALHGQLEQLRGACENGDVDAFPQADAEFHAKFFSHARHSRIQAIWEQYRASVEAVLLVSRQAYVDLEPSFQSHVVLLEIIEAGDADQAVAELAAHLENARGLVRGFYEPDARSA